MPSKVYAIAAPSATIALRYGPNVSKGIAEMNNVIKAQERYIEHCHDTNKVPNIIFRKVP
jgi:hypothetical protein